MRRTIFGSIVGGQDGGHDGGHAMLAALSSSAPGQVMPSASTAVPFDGSLDLESGKYDLLDPGTFPDASWDPSLRAQLYLEKFTRKAWFAPDLVRPGGPPDPSEIGRLISDVLLRPARLPEIIGQADDFTPYWCDLLMVTPASRPKTWLMLLTMLQIGTMVGMRYKWEYKQPRPVQLYPALMPVILTPGHPTYPNAHALQSYLIADFIRAAVRALGQAADNLADRIGRNREIAGVHFPRDRVASRTIADHVRPLLYQVPNAGEDASKEDANKPVLQDLLAEVTDEFPGLRRSGKPEMPAMPEPRTASG
jgi:acid phosphatase (class A)